MGRRSRTPQTGSLPLGTPPANAPFSGVDPLAGGADEQFEQVNKEAQDATAPTRTSHYAQYANDRSSGEWLNIVKPSRFVNGSTGETGTEWTTLGRAFKTAKGWKLIIKEGISVTGDLMLLPPQPER